MSVLSLNELFNEYVRLYGLKLSPSTLKSDILTYNKHIKNSIGKNLINEIKFIHIQELVNVLISKDYLIKTIKNILTRLSVVFNFAIKLDIINKNPVRFVELPRYDNKRNFFYSLKTQQDFIKALSQDKSKYSDLFLFLLHARRKSEILNLKFKDIDFTNKIYTIPYKINKAKLNMSYPMSDELFNRILKRFELSSSNLNDYVFKNEKTNNRLVCIKRAWKSFIKRHNLPYIRLHDIRHLVASYSINYLNISIEQVSFMLGHTNISTTKRYVTHNIDICKVNIEKMIDSV